MKRILSKVVMAIILLASLSACSNHTAAIDALVNELNSPAFRAEEAKTGMFDDYKAEISGDKREKTFLFRPFINLSDIKNEQLPELEASAIDEFKRNLINEKFVDGLEALRNENMTLLMVWQDVNGKKIEISIDPAKVLPEN